MSAAFNFEDFACQNQTGYFSPEKFTILKHVFDAASVEAQIPKDAHAERTELAEKLIVAGAIISETSDYESLLMDVARMAVVECRARLLRDMVA